MTIDFDALVNGPVLATFGGTVSYTPRGQPAFDLAVLYDEAWHDLQISAGRFGGFQPTSTTKPAMGFRLSAFPAGVQPQQGDTVVSGGRTFEVTEARPDGFGWVYIFLSDITVES